MAARPMTNSIQQDFLFDDPDSLTRSRTLNAVHARAEAVIPFDMSLFQGFTSMRALTYTSSIPMVLRLLRDSDFDSFECILGHGGILPRAAEDILAFQSVVDENLNERFLAIGNLSEERREVIYDRVAEGDVRFFVVKDAIAHAKIYLLERKNFRRVIVGSANLSETAFSGRQAETLIVFDCGSSEENDLAWKHYLSQYEAVRDISTSKLPLRREPVRIDSVRVEEIPALRDADASPEGITMYVPADEKSEESLTVPHVAYKIEKIRPAIRRGLADVRPEKNGVVRITSKIVKQMTHIVRSRQTDDAPSTYFSISNGEFTFSDNEFPLNASPSDVKSDVDNWLEFFGNYEHGFIGDIPRLQQDYFTFMCWFYFAPFMCDLRNGALRLGTFSFDQPMFAILYGASNCGKTSLVETLMQSMFSYPHIVETQDFTRSNLRGLQQAYKRFPVVFDDVARTRFNTHAPEIIKDESIPYHEYPCFALSMNADTRNFPDEIIKRCLMIYTRTSLPGDDTTTRRRLQRSVANIRSRMTTALYREYLKRTMSAVDNLLPSENDETDALQLSSTILSDLIRENLPAATKMPSWCRTVTLEEYQDRAFERPRRVLRSLLHSDRYSKESRPAEGCWTISGDSLVIAVPILGFSSTKADIPDWIVDDTGSTAGQIILKREPLEAFLGERINRPRRWLVF